VRVITDDEKALDLGSDVTALARAGVPVRTDPSPAHMHHKFAVFDRERLLTGSYNWTRGAARDNGENIIVTADPRLIERFARYFERLWESLG
jgi:cardiolipin hydrolase